MNFEEYLNLIGVKDIDAFRRKTHIKNVDLMKERVKYYKSRLNLSDDELADMVIPFPAVLGYSVDPNDPTSAANKLDFLQNTFKFSNAELSTFIKLCPSILSLSLDENEPTSFQARIEYFKTKFGFKENDILNHARHTPAILTHSTSSYDEKYEFYKKTFKISYERTSMMIKSFPNILIYDVESVINKIQSYTELLNCSHEEIYRIITSSPSFLSYDVNSDSPTSVKSKIKWYGEIFEIPAERVCEMIKRFPAMLCYGVGEESNTSIVEKLKYLREIASKEEIILNPALLSHPALQVKTRYLILSRAFNKHAIIGNRKMTTNEQKLWARLRYCEDKNLSLKNIIAAEGRFAETQGKTSEELIEEYPLTEKDIDMLEKQHFENTGENIVISQAERKAILAETEEKEME